MTASVDDMRNDLHLTSTGVGHQHQPSLSFPPIDFRRTASNPLPAPLSRDEHVQDHYKTTTGSAHNFKPANTKLSNQVFKKAAGHWKVSYTEDTIKKIQVKPQRRSLTMGNELSEMKAQYTGQPGLEHREYIGQPSHQTTHAADMQPKNYRHHHTDGPVKQLVPSTHNDQVAGDEYHVGERGVLSYHDDPYLTVTQKDHRAFTRADLAAYPRKEYGTYWECEGYPKAWGHGSKTNPLPPDSVPREKGPMRDRIWFKEATSVPRLPKSLTPLQHKGMKSEAHANFTAPSDEKRRELFACGVDTPYKVDGAGADEIFSIPKMYETEYRYYGGKKPVVVGP